MAHSLLSLLEQLQSKVSALQQDNNMLRKRNRELELLNAELLEKEAEAEKRRDKAILDAEYLSVSHRLAESPDTVIDARRMIAGLIRNIDRCIEMLKE